MIQSATSVAYRGGSIIYLFSIQVVAVTIVMETD
jgi:hypothetical protein